ncbi:hypothetical protein PLICRDRAFT_44116 [Plicaturopsis crispa FD-325 SS-3]|nr:hypothetical protein PLICRDRAFT_44116 [Plicaturopsis crispa FD-325 SS-3]
MPVTEICIFPASEAYRQDQSTVHPFARALASVPGFISFYHGLEIEDPSVGYGFVVWESLEAHQAFSASPAFGPALMLLTPSFGGAPSIIHARFDTDPTAALTSPTLEYVVLTVREGSSKKAVTEILQKIGHKDLPTVLGAAYGPVVEKEDAIVLAVGWESVEAQSALIRSFSPKMFKDFGTLVERADLHVKHVKMTKV